MSSWANAYRSNYRLVVLLAVAILVLLAWSNRFIQDDAFISFRYAQNFAQGDGLVWNKGVRVEGYTSFLWTVLASIPIYLNRDPVVFSYILGLVWFTGSLLFTYKLARDLSGSKNTALLAVVLLGSNFTFSSFATSGMETQMQTCLLLICVFLCLRFQVKPSYSQALLISAVASLSLLARLDSAVILALILPLTALSARKRSEERMKKLITIVCLVLPLAVITGVWLLWKVQYYGDILPNTFYARVFGVASLPRGVKYVLLFFYSYVLFPFPLMFVHKFRSLLERAHRSFLLLISLIILWLAYVIGVGGDFIEFRFIVPILPMFFVVTAWWISTQLPTVTLRIVMISMVLLGSAHHVLTFWGPYQIEGLRQLQGHVINPNENWRGIGQTLGRVFDHNQDILIATTAAGAIPYYSRLKTLDIHGLNDKWVARNGVSNVARPGHQRLAPLGYLTSERVNILIGHPWLLDSKSPPLPIEDLQDAMSRFHLPIRPNDMTPEDPQIIEIPIDAEHKLLAIYLTRHPVIDEVIRQQHWYQRPLVNRSAGNHPKQRSLAQVAAAERE